MLVKKVYGAHSLMMVVGGDMLYMYTYYTNLLNKTVITLMVTVIYSHISEMIALSGMPVL